MTKKAILESTKKIMLTKIKENWKEYLICIALGAAAIYFWNSQTKTK